MELKIEERMKEIEQRFEIEHNIFCPYCKHQQDEETNHNHVTYWGEDEPKECICDECGKEFMVKECVTRTWEEKTIEEYNEKEGW